MRSAPPSEGQQDKSRRGGVLSRNLVVLGLTSFFTDISSEMVLAVVPLFLTTSLGFSLFGFALYEAAYQAMSAFFRIVGGTVADLRQSHKKTAATGYTISAVTRFGLVLSSLVAGVPAVPFLLADRVGKGIRTAPRDALISLSTAPDRLAQAFGVHRALDTAGALLGPLVAFLILRSAPGAFDAVFVISAMFGALGVAVIWLFAQEKRQTVAPRSERNVRRQWKAVFATKGVPRVALAAGLVSLVTVGDAFIYLLILVAPSGGLSPEYFPLLFVGTALVYLVLAAPLGRLADQVGTRPVFLGGNALLIALYLVLGFTDLGFVAALICLALLGAYYAATDGVIPAMVSQLVPNDIRASGIALITVVIAIARMASAGIYVVLFQNLGRSTAMVVLAIAMAAAIAVAVPLLSASTTDELSEAYD